jgi:predicted RNA-binding protein YlqC (UPF0109 family)
VRDLLLSILHPLVQSPDAIALTETEAEHSTFFEIRCHPDDVGIIIGKNGKTISAIRVLLNALAGRDERQAVVEVIEPS